MDLESQLCHLCWQYSVKNSIIIFLEITISFVLGTPSASSTTTTNETPFLDKLLEGSNVYYIIGGGSGVLLFCYILFCWCCTCIYCKKSRKRKQTYTFKGL